MKLLALVLLLSAFSSLTLTEVMNDFKNFKSKCSDFFIKSPKQKVVITPTVLEGIQYKQICQRWENKYRYATLYDTKRRIPVYSAYTFSGGEHNNRNEEWKNEPQLEDIKNSPDMKLISDDEMDEFLHQAVKRDYKESTGNTDPHTEYTKGHVFPHQYAADADQADSTFAFTNVAPQTQHSNGEWAKEVENPMRKEIENRCKISNNDQFFKAFIVTGVVPGNKWITITRKERNKPTKIKEGVNIPTYYWTAFCCVRNDNEIISKAYLARQNEPNQNTYELSRMSVNMLNERLTNLYKQHFRVFGELCLTETGIL